MRRFEEDGIGCCARDGGEAGGALNGTEREKSACLDFDFGQARGAKPR